MREFAILFIENGCKQLQKNIDEKIILAIM